MESLQLVQYLIETNKKLVQETALANCHCIGLNSFIINEKPKIRLFIAEQNCELFQKFDYRNPVVPIHPHKYDDLFTQLEGEMYHHIYTYDRRGDLFNGYKYLRLSDKKVKIEQVRKEKLFYWGPKKVTSLEAKTLHTASLRGNKCSWLVTETFEDPDFKQVAYHSNLITYEAARPELYKPIANADHYLRAYFNF